VAPGGVNSARRSWMERRDCSVRTSVYDPSGGQRGTGTFKSISALPCIRIHLVATGSRCLKMKPCRESHWRAGLPSVTRICCVRPERARVLRDELPATSAFKVAGALLLLIDWNAPWTKSRGTESSSCLPSALLQTRSPLCTHDVEKVHSSLRRGPVIGNPVSVAVSRARWRGHLPATYSILRELTSTWPYRAREEQRQTSSSPVTPSPERSA